MSDSVELNSALLNLIVTGFMLAKCNCDFVVTRECNLNHVEIFSKFVLRGFIFHLSASDIFLAT